MTTDWKALCAELLESAKELDDLMQGAIDGDYMPDSLTLQPIRLCLERARTALAQPEPEGPTEEEIDALERRHWQLTGVVNESLQQEELFDYRAFLREGLARWGRPVTTQEAS